MQALIKNTSHLIHVMLKTLGREMLNCIRLYHVKPAVLNVGGTQYSPKDLVVTGRGLHMTLSPQR